MSLDEEQVYDCLICGKPVPGYTPQYCCSGRECGCFGEPLEPCICSNKCWDALMDGSERGIEERRIAAGIEKWQKTSSIGINET